MAKTKELFFPFCERLMFDCNLHNQTLIYEGIKSFQPDIPPPPHETTHPDSPQDKSWCVSSGARFSEVLVRYRDYQETAPAPGR